MTRNGVRSGDDQARSQPRRTSASVRLVAYVLMVLVVLGELGVVSRAWADCDVGVNSSANVLTLLLFGLPLLLAAHWVAVQLAWALMGAVVGRRETAPRTADAMRVALAFAVLAGGAAVVLVHVATPAGYPSPVCADNVPDWWPAWLPS